MRPRASPCPPHPAPPDPPCAGPPATRVTSRRHASSIAASELRVLCTIQQPSTAAPRHRLPTACELAMDDLETSMLDRGGGALAGQQVVDWSSGAGSWQGHGALEFLAASDGSSPTALQVVVATVVLHDTPHTHLTAHSPLCSSRGKLQRPGTRCTRARGSLRISGTWHTSVYRADSARTNMVFLKFVQCEVRFVVC